MPSDLHMLQSGISLASVVAASSRLLHSQVSSGEYLQVGSTWLWASINGSRGTPGLLLWRSEVVDVAKQLPYRIGRRNVCRTAAFPYLHEDSCSHPTRAPNSVRRSPAMPIAPRFPDQDPNLICLYKAASPAA